MSPQPPKLVAIALVLSALACSVLRPGTIATPAPDAAVEPGVDVAQSSQTAEAARAAQTQAARVAAEQATATAAFGLTATPARATAVAEQRAATRQAATATMADKATANAEPMFNAVADLAAQGYLGDTTGVYHSIPNFLKSWAQLGWYQFFDVHVLRQWPAGVHRGGWAVRFGQAGPDAALGDKQRLRHALPHDRYRPVADQVGRAASTPFALPESSFRLYCGSPLGPQSAASSSGGATMLPVLFTLGGVPIYSHGFFLVMGLLTGLAVLILEARRRRWPKEEVIPITLAAFVGGMIGARLSILFFNGWQAAPVVLNFFALFDPRLGPGSILGGVAGAYIAGYIASRAIGKAGCACDAFAPAMALATAVGRIGDFLVAEDGMGKPTSLPWGVYVQPAPGVSYLAHPAPLYDAAFSLIWFAILLAFRDHPRLQDGNLLKVGMGGYAVFRFFVEFVRNNQVLALGLTGQQFFCIVLVLALGLYYARRARQWQTNLA
jgi:prolipoprotein diacylglyceryl transferase